MNATAIFFDSKHLGRDTVGAGLGKFYGAPVWPAASMADTFASGGELERVILLDCLETYLENRLKVKGRPWVCLISSVFVDLYSAYRTSLKAGEMNVHAIFSNCDTFVKNAQKQLNMRSSGEDAEIDIRFSYRPVAPRELTPEYAFACSVPNVEDRDWSLAQIVADAVRGKAVGPMAVCLPDEASNRNSVPIVGERSPLGGSYVLCRDDVDARYYVPAPRITDYRVGAIPHEMLSIMASGGIMLAVKHPVLTEVLPFLLGFDSLKALSEFLRSRSAKEIGEKSADVAVSPLPEKFAPSIFDFAAEMDAARDLWLRRQQ